LARRLILIAVFVAALPSRVAHEASMSLRFSVAAGRARSASLVLSEELRSGSRTAAADGDTPCGHGLLV